MYVSLGMMVRNPEMTQEEFIEYWETVHAPLVRKQLDPMGLKQYTAMFPVHSTALYAGGLDYDAVVALGFETNEQLEAAMASPEFNCDERKQSSARCFDLSRVKDMTVRASDALA